MEEGPKSLRLLNFLHARKERRAIAKAIPKPVTIANIWSIYQKTQVNKQYFLCIHIYLIYKNVLNVTLLFCLLVGATFYRTNNGVQRFGAFWTLHT